MHIKNAVFATQNGGVVSECPSKAHSLPREDPGMSKGSSGQHGVLCLRGHQGRTPGCPRDACRKYNYSFILWARS